MSKARELSVVPQSPPAFKNRIINGAMVIDQRNAGASVTVPNTGSSGNVWGVDRFIQYSTQASKFSVQQNAGSVTPPAGFSNYLGHTSLSSYSVLSGDYFFTAQKIEGFNTSDLSWGTANAKTVTLSFWVYSSLTGTFGGSILNGAINYSYPFTYSIPVANTWTQISITIAGPTSGTWIGATNGIGMWIVFSLGTGSTASGTAGSWSANQYFSATGATSVVGTNGATFYITGVQLEKGSVATSFDYRPYGTELALCQRYFISISDSATQQTLAAGYYPSSTAVAYCVTYPTTMRANPSFSSSGTFQAGLGDRTLSSLTLNAGGPTSATIQAVCSGATAGQGTLIRGNGSPVALNFSAEL